MKTDGISAFGSTGFIGKKWMQMYPDSTFPEHRNSVLSYHNKIIYMRSTTDNYNVFSNPSLDVSTNLLLLTETLRNLRPENEFNFISSFFVYGKNKDENSSKKETDDCNPKGFYSITKRTAEQLIESYCETFNIPFRILRLANVIGGDFKANSKKNALEFIIQKLKRNEPVEIYKGDNYRNYMAVEDCCKAIKYVIEKGNKNEIYNIGAKNSLKLIDVVEFCKKTINSKSLISFIEPPKFHSQIQVSDFHMDTTKLQSLGFNNNFDICEVLTDLCQKL